MGNQLSDSPQSILTQIAELYEEARQIARGTVLLHKQAQTTFLLKEYSFASEPHFKAKFASLQEELARGPREYIVSLVRLESRVFSSFCSTSYKIYAIFQYPQVTLREEILARQKENKTFEEAQLWSILQSCSNALIELRPVLSLNPAQIFINPDGHLKVIHDDLVDESYRALLCDQIYYAPEKLRNFTRLDSELGLKKEAIFSMGMTLLEAAQLSEISSCYDYSQGTFDQSKLGDMLQLLTDKYSVDFVEALQNLLDANPNRRASLMEVQNMLENYWKSESYESSSHSRRLSNSNTQPQVQKIEEPSSAQKDEAQSPLQPQTQTLSERCLNTFSKNNTIEVQKPRDLQLPEDILTFKIKQPDLNDATIITPKNPITPKDNLYTDPRMLEMIKRDLADFRQMKNSTLLQTSKYTYLYPNTQTILNSIKNLDLASDSQQNQQSAFKYDTYPFDMQPNSCFKQNQSPAQSARKEETRVQAKLDIVGNDVAASKFMMKKNREPQLIFTIETYEDGRRYEGMTLNGRKHGQGKLIYEDGAYYQGEFKEDKMNGKGVLYYDVGQPAYEGDWQNDQFHGQGTLYNQNPEQLNQMFDFRNFNDVDDFWVKYEGEFVLDNKSGKGRLYLSNGQMLEGEFVEDYIHGDGCFKRQTGEVIEGIWEENMLTSIYQQQQQ